jgi:tRNA U38,U39,U40 pseudouridine synthase TruA
MRYLHCLQSVKARDAEKGSSSGKRKSIKESIFAVEHAEVLKPIYKYYQAMMFATHGHNFMWDAVRRKACVQMLLDAARECHSRETYTRFKKAVEAELVGKDGAPRYRPLPVRMMFG